MSGKKCRKEWKQKRFKKLQAPKKGAFLFIVDVNLQFNSLYEKADTDIILYYSIFPVLLSLFFGAMFYLH